MVTDKSLSVVTPALVFASGLERASMLCKSLAAIVTPLLVVGAGIMFALSELWMAPAAAPVIEDRPLIENSGDWLCPTKAGGPLVDLTQGCRFPAVSASTVKDMISAQLSCGACI